MKRVIAFTLVLALAVGGICFAHAAITGQQDDVSIYPSYAWGDSSVMAGRTLKLGFQKQNHLYWDCRYSFDHGETDTDFRYVQDPEREESQYYASMDIGLSLNFAASSSGTFSLRSGPYGDMVRAAAEQTANGESHTVTLKLADYAEYYQPSIYISCFDGERDCHIGEDIHHMMETDLYDSPDPFYPKLQKAFRFPVREEEIIEVTANLLEDGSLYGYDFRTLAGTQLWFANAVTEEGIYILPIFQDEQGQPLPYESPAGPGLYFAPWKELPDEVRKVPGGTIPRVEPDLEQMKLVSALEPASVGGAVIRPEEDRAWLLIPKDGSNHVTLVELSTGKILADTEAIPQLEDDRGRFLLEGEYLMVTSYHHLALLDRKTGQLLMTAPTSEAEHDGERYHVPDAFDPGTDALRFDGTRLTLLCRGQNQNSAFWVEVYEEGRLLYHGEFDSTLQRGGVYVNLTGKFELT